MNLQAHEYSGRKAEPRPCLGRGPTSEDVEMAVRRLAHRHPGWVRVQEAGRTSEGRAIPAVTVTDPLHPPEGKQHVLIVAGQHGDEESSRAIALSLLDWLVGDKAAAVRAGQEIVVMPNVSPDAADRDMHLTPAGVSPNLDHGPAGASSPEGKAVERVARELVPDAFVDLHARGGAGCSYGMVLWPRPRPYTEDGVLLHEMSAAMAAAAEDAGIPHVTHPLTWPGWGGDDPAEPSTTLFAYREYKSLVFLTETPESDAACLPMAQRIDSGLRMLRRLLDYGQRRMPFQRHAGYPCDLIGMRYAAIVPIGQTVAERRATRLALWRHMDAFRGPRLTVPEERLCKHVELGYSGPALNVSAGIQIRAAGCMDVVEVRLDGRELALTGAKHFETWRDPCSTYGVIPVSLLAPGQYHIDICFRDP